MKMISGWDAGARAGPFFIAETIGEKLMKKQRVSEAVIRRLPRYYRYLDDLHSRGVVRISSNSLGSRMGITASQRARDRLTQAGTELGLTVLDTFENLYCVGRNGQHRYNNMDHSMLTAMEAVDNLAAGIRTKENIWAVNTEEEYHETKSN